MRTTHTLLGTSAAPCNCVLREIPAGCCPICDGGLASCVVCRGAERSLPTECPGVEIGSYEQEGVMAGKLDFRGGEWVSM